MTKKEDLLILLHNYHQRLVTLIEYYRNDRQTTFEEVRHKFRMIEEEILPDLKQLVGEGHKYYRKIYSNLYPIISTISYDRRGQINDLHKDIVDLIKTIERVGNLVEKNKYSLKKIKKPKEPTTQEKEQEITNVIMILDVIFGSVVSIGLFAGIIVVFFDPIQSVIPFFVGSSVGFVLWIWITYKLLSLKKNSKTTF
ncbi:MAG: hypothetical protein ACFFD2_08730 [Promethearchaeota archaeon]